MGVSLGKIDAEYFPDARLVLQVFCRISIQFDGFSEQHQEKEDKLPVTLCGFWRAKPLLRYVQTQQNDASK